ncbi:MAG: hypothetical protein AAFZ07_25380 [Actinomycetota bacterium]
MSRRSLAGLLAVLAALTTACATDWPPEIDAALEAGEAREVEGIDPSRLPQGDPLPNDGEWTDIGWGVGMRRPDDEAVHVDRVVVSEKELTVELTIFNLRDNSPRWILRNLHQPRLLSEHGFTISPTEVRFVDVPAAEVDDRPGRSIELASGESVRVLASFERPLADPPTSVEVTDFEPVPLDLD